jgi:hypothetical protein
MIEEASLANAFRSHFHRERQAQQPDISRELRPIGKILGEQGAAEQCRFQLLPPLRFKHAPLVKVSQQRQQDAENLAVKEHVANVAEPVIMFNRDAVCAHVRTQIQAFIHALREIHPHRKCIME